MIKNIMEQNKPFAVSTSIELSELDMTFLTQPALICHAASSPNPHGLIGPILEQPGAEDHSPYPMETHSST